MTRAKEVGEYIKVSTLIAIIPLLFFLDTRHMLASDFDTHLEQHIISDIDWYEERVEDLQLKVIKLESLGDLNAVDVASLSTNKNRIAKYIRRIKGLRSGIEN